MKFYDTNASNPRFETHDGQRYLVVPVVMARAGVEMNGATITEDQLHAESWNGVPVTVTHPKDADGNDISANSPDVLQRYQVGTIFNATVEDAKLKAEAWVNVQKAGSELVERLKNMEAMDVSTGYFSQIEGGQYKDIKPDHLALLPNEEGACNFNDGCGVRANFKERVINTMKQYFGADKLSEAVKMRLNQKGYREIMRALQRKLDEMDRADATHYLIDVFEDDFIYKVDKESGTKYYRRNYSSGDEISMGEQVQQVRKEINYEPVTNAGTDMTDQLISNEASPFTEEDREFLEAMSEEKITSLGEKYLNDTEKPETNEKETKANEDKPETVLSNEDREALEIARQAREDKREEYITHITANSEMCPDKLKAMDTGTLKEIASGIKPAPDYSGRGFGTMKASSTNEEVLEAMSTPSTKEIIMNKREKVN